VVSFQPDQMGLGSCPASDAHKSQDARGGQKRPLTSPNAVQPLMHTNPRMLETATLHPLRWSAVVSRGAPHGALQEKAAAFPTSPETPMINIPGPSVAGSMRKSSITAYSPPLESDECEPACVGFSVAVLDFFPTFQPKGALSLSAGPWHCRGAGSWFG